MDNTSHIHGKSDTHHFVRTKPHLTTDNKRKTNSPLIGRHYSSKKLVNNKQSTAANKTNQAVHVIQHKIEKHKWTMGKITKPNEDKNFLHVQTKVKDKITQLDAKSYLMPNDKEELKRLKTLMNVINTKPNKIMHDIYLYSSNPMYKYMGDVKFLSMLAQSRENTKDQTHDLSNLQMVAIYGWSTGDYTTLNKALREAKGEKISDPGIDAYLHYVIGGMKKLPDVSSPITLQRAIFPPLPDAEWADRELVKGTTYRDYGFMSTTTKLDNQGIVNLDFVYPKGAPTYAKKIGTFSAWNENEILIMPNVKFAIAERNGNQVTLIVQRQ
jgi:hypothetical protein